MNDEPEVGDGRAVPAADRSDEAVAAVAGASGTSGDSEVRLSKSESTLGQDANSVVGAEAEPNESEGDRESELVGAVSAGSARAAARRSGVRAGSTPAKGAATKARDTGRDDRGSLFARLRRFLREVVSELRKVIWPARNQMVTYTIVVIVFVVVMVAITAGLDLLFAKGVLTVFG